MIEEHELPDSDYEGMGAATWVVLCALVVSFFIACSISLRRRPPSRTRRSPQPIRQMNPRTLCLLLVIGWIAGYLLVTVIES